MAEEAWADIGPKQRQLAREAMKMIDRWKDDEIADLTATELARRLDVTPQHLSRAFNNHYYSHLRTWIKRRKMMTAAWLMGSEEYKTVKEVLEKMDIQSFGHFIGNFKEHWAGKTPGQYNREEKKRIEKFNREFEERMKKKYG